MEEPVTRRWLPTLLLLTACGGTPPPRPPEPFTPPEPESVQLPEPRKGELPTKDDAVQVQAQLPNKLTTLQLKPVPSNATTAEIVLGIAVGTENGKQGLCDLALALLLTNGDATKGRPGLLTSITELGGSIAAERGLLSTWLTIRLPADRWQQGLKALAQALVEPPPGRAQLERLQRESLADAVAAVQKDTAHLLAQRLMLGDADTVDHLTSLRDRDAGEALLFQARNFRPEATVLALRVQGEPMAIAAAVAANFASWNPAPITPDPNSGPNGRQMKSGLYWLPGDGPSQVTMVFAQPNPFQPDAVAHSVLLNCLTMDGIGGRLEHLLHNADIRDLTWTTDFMGFGESSALLLSTTTTSDRAARIWQLAQSARRSLRELPPTDSELELARARARLTLRRAETEPGTSLRMIVTRALNRQSEAKLQEMLLELEQRGGLDPKSLMSLQQLPMAMIVIGGQPPTTPIADLKTIELLPPNLVAQVTPARSEELIQKATNWLDKSVEAVGGRDRLLQLKGFQTEARLEAEQAPPVDEVVQWSIDGTARRKRTVLGTVVETDLTDKAWVESSGDKKTQLTPTEARWQLSEIERHPLAILSAYVRGTLKFRLLADRVLDGRNYLVLEATGERFDRLRLAIDRQSGLIRTVETWTTSPQGTPTAFVDTWTDHRSIDGLRFPFRRVTVVDDNASRRVTNFSKIAARFE
jgi:hypothetical protein